MEFFNLIRFFYGFSNAVDFPVAAKNQKANYFSSATLALYRSLISLNLS